MKCAGCGCVEFNLWFESGVLHGCCASKRCPNKGRAFHIYFHGDSFDYYYNRGLLKHSGDDC
jgi:hypothetical protein